MLTFQLCSGLLSNILNCNLIIVISVALEDYLMKEIMLEQALWWLQAASFPHTWKSLLLWKVKMSAVCQFQTIGLALESLRPVVFGTHARIHTHTDTHTSKTWIKNDTRALGQVERNFLALSAVFYLEIYHIERLWTLALSVFHLEHNFLCPFPTGF